MKRIEESKLGTSWAEYTITTPPHTALSAWLRSDPEPQTMADQPVQAQHRKSGPATWTHQ